MDDNHKALYRAADEMRSACIFAHEELFFGGNWEVAREQIINAEKKLRRILKDQYPEDGAPQYFGDPFD